VETLKQATSQISVKLYSSIPTCAIYQTDEKIWVALFWLKTQSANKMNFIIDGTTSNEARTHFIDQIHALDETSIKVDMTSQKLKIPELQSIPNQTVSMFKKI